MDTPHESDLDMYRRAFFSYLEENQPTNDLPGQDNLIDQQTGQPKELTYEPTNFTSRRDAGSCPHGGSDQQHNSEAALKEVAEGHLQTLRRELAAAYVLRDYAAAREIGARIRDIIRGESD